MTDWHRPEDKEDSLNTLIRAITKSGGSFSLILARCNYTACRDRIVQQLREQCPVFIRELLLEQSVKTLYTTIEAELGSEQPKALMVFGLESVSALDHVLSATNRVREEFRNFAFPLVLWVTDDVLQKLIRLVPDFHSWATTIEFARETDELIQFIQQTTDEVFAKVLDAGASLFLDNTALNLGVGSSRRAELEFARRELQHRGVSLGPKLEASLEFVLGRDGDNSLEEARSHYERSLDFWLHSDNLERRGCLLFFLGLWWRTYLLGHRNEYKLACRKSKDYFQQAIEVFEKGNRPDLVAKFINPLGDSLQRLKEWDELEYFAHKALVLHQSNLDLFKLARAYGFLAEVALANSDWSDAQKLAQLALSLQEQEYAQATALICEPVEENATLDWERSFHRGWYLFSLGKAYSAQGQVKDAIATLEEARETTKSQYDPELYIQILEELRSLYFFKQRAYRKAFQTKQERRAIEHQYGFRAFIGAGRLQPKKQVTNPALPNLKQQATVAEEITASGRQQDLNRLVERLGRPDYRLTVIHGQSGVGKSSLLEAGLIPALKQKSIDARDLVPILMQDYTDWIRKLGECVAEALRETENSSSREWTHPAVPIPLDSTSAILNQLQTNFDNNLLTVLILDQVEEFFFTYKDPSQRRIFYNFLQECMDIPYVKVILSLRDSSISYLLEWNRLTDLEVLNNNPLDKSILYYLGNFSLDDAKSVIKNFTTQAHFNLEVALIDELVKDLAAEAGEVRPIELQVVGAQLQAENITTLKKYRQSGPKAELIRRFLEELIKDCGPENEQVARLVLYLLTDESGTRPIKNYADLAKSLAILEKAENLDLVLEILVQSGLVFQLSKDTTRRYQLVHDYLIAFIRQQHDLLAQLEQQKQQLIRQQAEIDRLRKVRRILRAGAAVGLVMTILATWAEGQRRLAKISEIKTHAASSEAYLAGNKALEALRESLIAGRQLQRATWANNDNNTRVEVLTALHQAVYGTSERNRLEGHNGSVFSLSFSPDGQTLASASSDNTIKVWNRDGSVKTTLEGHQKSVFDVSFSRDGQTIASASQDGTVKIWKLDGTLPQTLKGHLASVLSVSFSPDGKTIASTSADKTVRIWNADGSLRTSIKAGQESIRDVSFSPDGKTIASAGFDDTVKLWNLDGTLLQTFKGHRNDVLSVSFSPDGKTIASASLDDTVKLWSLEGRLLRTLKGHENGVRSVSFSPDGQTLASASQDGTVKLWNSDGNLLTTLKGHQYWVHSVSFSSNEMLASAGSDRTIRLWNLDSLGFKTITGHQGRVSNISFSPDGQIIASASGDKTVKLWKRDGTLIRTLNGHKAEVLSVSFSPDGKMLASGSGDDTKQDNTVKLWELDGTVHKTLTGHTDSVLSVSFSPDGQIIASASRDKTIKLWNRDGMLLRTLKGHRELINWVSFSPDGKLIASASDDNTVKVWSSDGTLVKTLEAPKQKGDDDKVLKGVFSVNFSPDGKTLGAANGDGTVKLWSLNGKEPKTLEGHTDRVYSVSFSRDGQILASASRDGTVKLWKSDGTLLITFKRHEGAVNWVSFSPDGDIVASSGDDRTVVLWNLNHINLDDLLHRGCDRIHDYLKTNPYAKKSNTYSSASLSCDGLGTQK